MPLKVGYGPVRRLVSEAKDARCAPMGGGDDPVYRPSRRGESSLLRLRRGGTNYLDEEQAPRQSMVWRSNRGCNSASAERFLRTASVAYSIGMRCDPSRSGASGGILSPMRQGSQRDSRGETDHERAGLWGNECGADLRRRSTHSLLKAQFQRYGSDLTACSSNEAYRATPSSTVRKASSLTFNLYP